MQNARLDEAQAGIKIAGRNINNLRYADDFTTSTIGLPGGTSGTELPCQCMGLKRPGLDPWVRKISWRRKWQPTPVFLPGESYGLRSLASYIPWSCKRSNITEVT